VAMVGGISCRVGPWAALAVPLTDVGDAVGVHQDEDLRL
jgi:hypothetical protein